MRQSVPLKRALRRPTAASRTSVRTSVRRRRTFPRDRLFVRLEQALGESAALWIQGPPGAGKTTLVRDFLESRGRRAIWLQLDAGDSDPATFFHSLTAAAASQLRDVRPVLSHFTFEYQRSLATFGRRYFERLWTAMGGALVLVLDNSQEIDASSPMHLVLDDAISRLPAHVHVVFVSRTAPPATYARARVHRLLQTMGDEELLLSEEEAYGIASILRPHDASLRPADVERLRQSAHSWTAGLILLLERSPAGEPDDGFLSTGTRELLFDYFAAEILTRSDETTRHTLLAASVLPFMTRDLACAISGSSRGGDIIHGLHQRNYFVARAAGSDVYQFHPLFHDFLRAQLTTLRTRDEHRALSLRAAQLLDRAGHREHALDLYVAAEDWPSGVRTLLAIAPALVEQGRTSALEGHIQKLPAQTGVEGAWLAYWSAVCQLPRDPRESYRNFERAFTSFESLDPTGQVLAWSGAVNSILLQWDDFTRADEWIAWLNGRSTGELEALPTEVYASCAESMMTALMFRRVQQRDFPDWVERALRSVEQMSGRGSRTALTFFGLSAFAAATANLPLMTRARGVLTTIDDRAALTPLMRIARCYADGAYYFLCGDFRRAADSIERGIELGEETGVTVWEAELIASAAHIAMARGDPAEARPALDRLAARFDAQRLSSQAERHFATGWYALMSNDVANAVTHAERAVETIRDTSPFAELICRCGLAQAYFAAARPVEARRELSVARDLADCSGLPQWKASYDVIEAGFALAEGDEASAVTLLADALPKMREAGCISRFAWLKQPMTCVFTCALRHGIEVSFVQGVVRQNPGAFEAPPPDVAAWPFPVKVYTIGHFAVHVENVELRFATKTQKRPLELLKALVAFGGVKVREDAVADALWPDADADAAARSLTTTLHRLRRLIGDDTVLRQEGRLTLNAVRCWTDAAALDWALRAFDERDEPRDPAAVAAFARSLLTRYRRRFLDSDADLTWIVEARTRLQRRVLRALESAARDLDASDPELAARCRHRARELVLQDQHAPRV